MSDFEADFDGAALAEAWRAHRREGLRHLVVTGRDGAPLGTYAGDGAGAAAPPAQLVAAIVSQAQKMRLGNLESLVALYDRLCLVVLDAAPFAVYWLHYFDGSRLDRPPRPDDDLPFVRVPVDYARGFVKRTLDHPGNNVTSVVVDLIKVA